LSSLYCSNRTIVGVLSAITLLAYPVVGAQIAVSANDGKVMLVDGVNTPMPIPLPDTVSIIDLRVFPPKFMGEVRAPTSVAGPPHSVAIAPDQSIAMVTASSKIDPANPKEAVQNDQVTVIDLQAQPPRVLATLQAGLGASGIDINRAGTLALIANRGEGTVSVFSIKGKLVTSAGKVDLKGGTDSMPSQVMFASDGRSALVSCNSVNDNRIAILTVNGDRVEYEKSASSAFFAGLRPYGMDITPSGDMAVVASIGTGLDGGVDIVTLVDLKTAPPRAIDQIVVGPVPEAVSISPDGRYVAVSVMNGTNATKASGFYHDFGLLKILRIEGQRLSMVAETRIGHWCQGAAWTPNSKTVLVQCMVEKEIQMFGFDGKILKPSGSIKVNGGPAGIRTSR
jgi:DNA-binding beta-propeller fold protein YncE